MLPLEGVHVLNLAVNVPGPVAAARMRDWGARVTKIEPPNGDPLAYSCPAWHRDLTAGIEIIRLDLKTPDARAHLDRLLESADLLLTAHRPAALERLGLAWDDLHPRFPRLCHVAIVGHLPPRENEPGHDLNYQAELGTLLPPHLPPILIADMAGAEQAVSAAMALLLARERGQGAGFRWISLFEAGAQAVASHRCGLTAPGGLLGGALPHYALYASKEGHVAVALLEGHFLASLQEALNEPLESSSDYARVFLARTAREWEQWALERGLPITAVR